MYPLMYISEHMDGIIVCYLAQCFRLLYIEIEYSVTLARNQTE